MSPGSSSCFASKEICVHHLLDLLFGGAFRAMGSSRATGGDLPLGFGGALSSLAASLALLGPFLTWSRGTRTLSVSGAEGCRGHICMKFVQRVSDLDCSTSCFCCMPLNCPSPKPGFDCVFSFFAFPKVFCDSIPG